MGSTVNRSPLITASRRMRRSLGVGQFRCGQQALEQRGGIGMVAFDQRSEHERLLRLYG